MAINDIYVLPDLSRNMSEMTDLLQAEQNELYSIQNLIVDLEYELCMNTCNDLLSRYETIFAITHNDSLTFEERKLNLITKANTRSYTTIQTIKDLVMIILECECDVIEYYNEYRFFLKIYFSEHNTTNDLYEILAQIEIIKPAHIAYGVAIAVETVTIQNKNTTKIKRFKLRYKESNIIMYSVLLDGSYNLDGKALLNYESKDVQFKKFSMRIKSTMTYQNTVNLNELKKGYLNCNMYLDGKYQLNIRTTEEI